MSEDINSFEYFEEMTTNWSRLDLLRRCYGLCNEMVEKQKEIERLKEDFEKEKYLVDKYTRQLTDEYKNTEYQCKEKERLNNIIKRYDKFIKRRLELDGYSDTFIKHQMRELKTPDYNDLLNTRE